MTDRFFDQPILNSPYEYPRQHWVLDFQGQPTGEIADRRRRAEFITPIPRPKKQKPGQKGIVFEEGQGLSTEAQQYEVTSAVINELRQQVDAWRALPNPDLQRKVVSSLLLGMVREAVVNARIHPGHQSEGATCQLTVTADTIAVKSPGRPLSPITLEALQAFDAPMLSCNPRLHYVFTRMGGAEERGFGIPSLKAFAEKAGLPLPRHRFEASYLELVLHRHPESPTNELPQGVREALTESERAGWRWLTTQGRAQSSQYAKAFGVDDRTARRHLKRFEALGLARTTGSGQSTTYEVI